MDTTESQGRLNNAQRKAIVEIVGKRFAARVDAARQAEEQLERQITSELTKKFGLGAIEAEIERLEKQIKNLRERREELGFDKRYTGDWYIKGGRAKALLEAKVKNRSLAVRRLNELQTRTEQQVWLAATIAEVDELLRRTEDARTQEAA
jgi:hypothetical protein